MPLPTITYETRDGRTITVEARYKHAGGYPSEPGTGPDGETCGTCKNMVIRNFSKTYFKCGLINYTGGAATDIRKRSSACKHWESE